MFLKAHAEGDNLESVPCTLTAVPMSLLEIEIMITKIRILDFIPQNATHKGSVNSINSVNHTLTSPATAITYNTFTVRAQKRASIMSDIARLAQHPLQKNRSSKDFL